MSRTRRRMGMGRFLRTRLVPLGAAVLVLLGGGGGAGCGGDASRATPAGGVRFVVLGFDGMDWTLARQLMEAGRMPNFRAVAARGTFAPLGTALPPQSPVAWSDFITGMDSGGHGIFDFVHRDPETMTPYLSTSRTHGSERALRLGDWRVPLSGGTVELLRQGTAFWEVLEAHGVHTTIVRMPANFPPSGKATHELSGMGTPDVLGTYGTFSWFASDLSRVRGSTPDEASAGAVSHDDLHAMPATTRDDGTDTDGGGDPSGGHLEQVQPVNGTVHAALLGPPNPFRADGAPARAPFTVHVDPVDPVALLEVGDARRVLRAGEWSDWVPVTFGLAPTQTLHGIARFYLQSVRPFALYVSPVNIDPMHPGMPISTPGSWAADLARRTGRFYTQGMPEDTKALTSGVFDPREFLEQARIAGDEIREQYHAVLDDFLASDEGLLFYYFGNLDQISHMMWRPMDPQHPAYDAARDAPFADVVPALYASFDSLVGETLAKLRERDPDVRLVVMSDHGFTSWRRAFHLNAWLREQGYLVVRGARGGNTAGAAAGASGNGAGDDPGMLARVDWRRTRAYGLGLNGLYLNLRGRERWGMVPERERQALLDEITRKLLATIDPATGEPVVTRVFRREDAYRDRGGLERGPDLVLGYARGTRCSNASASGKVPDVVFEDNTDWWSGDHCMDPEAVPGILLCDRPLRRPVARLRDLAPALLAEFGLEGSLPAP